jgi:uncharacterized membrane protein
LVSGISSLVRVTLALTGALPWVIVAFGHHSFVLRPVFRSLCHQMPERTLDIFGTPMVVCSRCAGIYAGIALGAIMPPLVFMSRFGRVVVFIAFISLLADVLIQNYLLHSVNHFSRVATGVMAGFAASAFLLSSLNSRLREPKLDTQN